MSVPCQHGHRQLDPPPKAYPARAVAGMAIGILVADAGYPMLPGNVANACTYDFPVVYKVLENAPVEKIMRGDPSVLDSIIGGGWELVARGARAVVGACGSFANYQKATAAALDVPVFLSVMLQVPLILQALKPDQALGIVAASRAAMTPGVYEQCAIADASRCIVTEVLDLPQFQALIGNRSDFDSRHLQEQVVARVLEFTSEHRQIGALLLQCSDLPPYAHAIQDATGLAVFDMNTLINWVYGAVVRRPYDGIV